jgi:uncharacterized protein (TIGR03067 family)
MRLGLAVAAVAILLLLAGDLPVSDRDRIQGAWEVAGVEFNGQALPEGPDLKRFQEMRLTFQGESVLNPSEKDVRGRFILDASKNPPALDIITTKKQIERKMLCVYQLENDTLRLCFLRNSDIARPGEVTSNNQQFLLIFKRQKAPAK